MWRKGYKKKIVLCDVDIEYYLRYRLKFLNDICNRLKNN